MADYCDFGVVWGVGEELGTSAELVPAIKMRRLSNAQRGLISCAMAGAWSDGVEVQSVQRRAVGGWVESRTRDIRPGLMTLLLMTMTALTWRAHECGR